MAECVIYARVSTKEQEREGYSIPAQRKAIEAFCEHEGYSVAASFVEAESAGKAGRKQFEAMCAWLVEHPDVRVVVAHKLDRLYRNFTDMLALEEGIGAKVRYVVSDIPEGPQGELLRDVNLSVAKFYLSNLREEVRKGMAEKVAQGGWPHRAPLGYRNDRDTRELVVDPDTAPLVVHAFTRYATGSVSLLDLADELTAMGLRSAYGNPISRSALHKLLRNPIYIGLLRWKGKLHPASHEPLVTVDLFERVAASFEPNRTCNHDIRHTFALRDFLYCAECGCKITAGIHRGYVYYRCTNGKRTCSQRAYTREEVLVGQMDELLSRIELPADIVDALLADVRALEVERAPKAAQLRESATRALSANRTRAGALLDRLLDGVIDETTYRTKAAELADEAAVLEQRIRELAEVRSVAIEQVEALARAGAGARVAFAGASTAEQREVLSTVLCNATVEGGRIVSYQWKDPFGFLERSPEGAFCHSWWALEDLNL